MVRPACRTTSGSPRTLTPHRHQPGPCPAVPRPAWWGVKRPPYHITLRRSFFPTGRRGIGAGSVRARRARRSRAPKGGHLRVGHLSGGRSQGSQQAASNISRVARTALARRSTCQPGPGSTRHGPRSAPVCAKYLSTKPHALTGAGAMNARGRAQLFHVFFEPRCSPEERIPGPRHARCSGILETRVYLGPGYTLGLDTGRRL